MDTQKSERDAPQTATDETCEHCGDTKLVWRNCKLICTNCRAIVKSCADL